MRLRNVKNKDEILSNCPLVIKDYKNHCGKFKDVFASDLPLAVEIGTGKCKFIIESAKKYPNYNFLGIEKSPSVLALGVKKIKEDIPNLRFICASAMEIDVILSHEVSILYLNFSDPWPKARHENRRLTSPVFLDKYDKIFKEKAYIVQKTDNQKLFEYSLSTLSQHGYAFSEVNLDLQNEANDDNIMTEYEIKFTQKGNPIYRVKAEKIEKIEKEKN